MSQHCAPRHLRVGTLQTVPNDGGPTLTQDIVCCKHCGYMWQYAPGSGRIRGFCMNCNGFLCGRRWCRENVPCRCWQHGIDNIERGLPFEAPAPILVSVPDVPRAA
jgi:hypothetical protein